MTATKATLGKLVVVIGPMLSGKTAILAGRANLLKTIAHRQVLVVMPVRDNRRSTTAIVSLNGTSTPAISVDHPNEILALIETQGGSVGVDDLFIDEVQFFRQQVLAGGVLGWIIVDVVKQVLRLGINVYVAGLNADSLTRPFPPTTDLLGIADVVNRVQAICTECGEPADWSLRLRGGKPIGPEGELIVVAGTTGEEGTGGETYTAVCARHHPFI